MMMMIIIIIIIFIIIDREFLERTWHLAQVARDTSQASARSGREGGGTCSEHSMGFDYCY